MRGLLNRWLHTAKPGSWRYGVVWLYIYAIVVYHRTKWGLVRLLPAPLQVRCLLAGLKKDAGKDRAHVWDLS